ncbi:MAG: tetratricopeptide repeat protein, partial [Alphaproteobacteria bacterium]|nr:tetratricopeptide repeat protein [Alphaproteobacteria bacterium]
QRPNYVTAISNLAYFYAKTDRSAQAVEYFNHAAKLSGNELQSLLNKANGHLAGNKIANAKPLFERALALDVNSAEAHLGVAKCFHNMCLYPAAEVHARRARELAKGNRRQTIYINAMIIIVSTAAIAGRSGEVITLCEELMELVSNMPFVYSAIALAYTKLSDYDRAIGYAEKAVAMDPEQAAEPLNTLGMVYRHRGDIPKSREYFLQAAKCNKVDPLYYHNYLFTTVYDAEVSKEDLARLHRDFDKIYCQDIKPYHSYKNEVNPEKKLRIGFVSPDIRNHPVFMFLLPMLRALDRDRFEIFIYYNYAVADACTARAQKMADGWEFVVHYDQDALAKRIRDDQIDILIDPTGHTGYNRLLVFARRPSPLQVTWLGHPHSTGMSSFDYRITDHFAEPVGLTEHLNSEKLLRLPELFCCFEPYLESWPDVIDHPPADDNDVVTFGCFNTFAKVTPGVIKLWSEILNANTNARLMIETPGLNEGDFRNTVLQSFLQHGVAESQLILLNRESENQYVLYNKVDVALDPFPLNGGTTTFDALWMGVPVITLAGDHFRSRMGATIVSNAGLLDCVAQSETEYMEIASKFATDREYLRKTRENLRARVVESPLMNAKRFCRNFETAMRQIWREWCEKQPAPKGKKA